jgi:hypothetical protein
LLQCSTRTSNNGCQRDVAGREDAGRRAVRVDHAVLDALELASHAVWRRADADHHEICRGAGSIGQPHALDPACASNPAMPTLQRKSTP